MTVDSGKPLLSSCFPNILKPLPREINLDTPLRRQADDLPAENSEKVGYETAALGRTFRRLSMLFRTDSCIYFSYRPKLGNCRGLVARDLLAVVGVSGTV